MKQRNTRDRIDHIHNNSHHPIGEEIFDVFDTFDKQKISNYVIRQVIKHKVSMLTFGKQGEIYKVPLPYEGGEKYFLVAKKKKDTGDYDLRNEFRLQNQTYDKVKHPTVKIPELFGYQEMPNGEQFIVMEYVPGQTLYTLLLNKVVAKNKPERTPAKDDREADSNMLKIFGLETTKHTLGKIEANPYIYRNFKRMKLFTQEQAKEIKKNLKEFLDNMHKNGIYHRDLGTNIRNIIFCPDGKIYLIDFGKAKNIEDIKKGDDIYREYTEKGIDEYASDEEIMDIIDTYTEKDT
ncbi:MAG TPA: protein kinase [Candidatus Absconditabacterales bacterium]|nr:protein kinase [Candidatus Absconditabacterales bacterium]